MSQGALSADIGRADSPGNDMPNESSTGKPALHFTLILNFLKSSL